MLDAGVKPDNDGGGSGNDMICDKNDPYDYAKTQIKNTPPKINESSGEIKFNGDIFRYQVKAEDPDGDALAYSLKTAPAGMTINPATGLIQWNVPADFKDKAEIKVSVSDGHGGEATQSFSFTMK